MPFIMSPTIGELAKALAAAQPKLEPALKNAVNPHLKSRYADLRACYEAARDVLAAHGLSVVQLPGRADGDMVTLQTMLLHTSGEYLGDDTGVRLGTVTPQALGSVLTYLRRYAYSAAIGLSTADDDGAAASIEPAPPRKPTPAPVSVASAPTATAHPGADPTCPVCDGLMWDNREGKKNPRAPDYKCRDKSCNGAIWPPRSSKPKASPMPEPEPGRFDAEEPPPSIDDLF